MPRRKYPKPPPVKPWIIGLSCGHAVTIHEKAYVPRVGSYDRCPACNAVVEVQFVRRRP
jgi:hypothetical protein